jgi:CheY-like chemotaxis protein
MSESTLEHIFEPFFSTKDTTTTSGLGLSTVHGIISQSKGRIERESGLGLGATFRIYLPLAADKPSVAVARPADTNGFRILLAEDDPVVNKHLTRCLRDAGFTVDAVCNGEEALSHFGRHCYHALVTDIVMPKLSGVELTKRLHQLLPSLPVVLISGYSEEISVLQDFPSHRISYLQKPFSGSQLASTLQRLLSSVEAEDKT